MMNLPLYHMINFLYTHFIQKLDNLLGTTFSKPSIISLAITCRCNSLCKMCTVKKGKKEEEISTNQMKKLIIYLKKWLGPFILNFTGGEPTLRKDIWELIALANNLNIRPVLCTNGTLITKKNIPLLINSGLRDIRISLDSLNSKTYKKIRRKNFHKRVLRTINLLKKYTDISISINTVITKHNVDELLKIVEFTKQKKLNSISLIPLGIPGAIDVKKELKPLWPDYKKVETVIDQIIEYKKNGYPITNPIRYLKLIKKYYKYPDSINEKCRASQSILIKPTGQAKICSERLGSIVDKPPQKIWNSKENKQLKKKLSKCRKSCAFLPCFSCTYNSLMSKFEQAKRLNIFKIK